MGLGAHRVGLVSVIPLPSPANWRERPRAGIYFKSGGCVYQFRGRARLHLYSVTHGRRMLRVPPSSLLWAHLVEHGEPLMADDFAAMAKHASEAQDRVRGCRARLGVKA